MNFPLFSKHLAKPGFEDTKTGNNGGSSKIDFRLNAVHIQWRNTILIASVYNVPSRVLSLLHIITYSWVILWDKYCYLQRRTQELWSQTACGRILNPLLLAFWSWATYLNSLSSVSLSVKMWTVLDPHRVVLKVANHLEQNIVSGVSSIKINLRKHPQFCSCANRYRGGCQFAPGTVGKWGGQKLNPGSATSELLLLILSDVPSEGRPRRKHLEKRLVSWVLLDEK